MFASELKDYDTADFKTKAAAVQEKHCIPHPTIHNFHCKILGVTMDESLLDKEYAYGTPWTIVWRSYLRQSGREPFIC